MKKEEDRIAMDPGAYILLLEMQVEQLEAALSIEKESHRKASTRATASEKRYQKAKAMLDDMEGDIGILAQCWNCPDLGKHKKCAGCTNSAVFQKNGSTYEWRGIRKHSLK